MSTSPTGPNTPSSSPDSSPARHLRAALGASASQPLAALDQIRVLELAGLLAEVVLSLDQVAWGTWKAVAPGSSIKRPGPLKDTLARFASGDDDITGPAVKQELDRLRQLAAALLAATNQGGRQFAQKHVQKFAPAEIEALAKLSGGGGLLSSPDARNWRKYVELAGPADPDALQRELNTSITACVESLLKGLAR